MQLFFQFIYVQFSFSSYNNLYVAQDVNGYLSCVSNWIFLKLMIVLFTCMLLLA